MRAPRTRFIQGKPVTEPRGQSPVAPSGRDCRARLQSCGMVVGDVTLVHESLEARIWQAETDRGLRSVTWSNMDGWSIKPIAPSLPTSKGS